MKEKKENKAQMSTISKIKLFENWKIWIIWLNREISFLKGRKNRDETNEIIIYRLEFYMDFFHEKKTKNYEKFCKN